ncbi:MAG: LysR family transcriptional regulator [Candidatus Tritonobacter lacicola]|nr:LysR family transcriptional regulator [Candidatus Tritonobacter lacicola]
MSRYQSTKKGRRARADAEAILPDGTILKARFWLERNGETFLAAGRVALLEAIERCGSLSGAAREMGISYRHAWLMADAINRFGPKKLFETSPAGSHLTEDGKKWVKMFHDLNKKFKKTLSKESLI